MKFNPLIVKEIFYEVNDAVRISFNSEQYRGEYKFKQGQYLTLKLNIDGQEVRRSYSICNSPYDEKSGLEIVVKKIPNGLASTFLNDEAKVGDAIEVQTPEGQFYTELHPDGKKTYILFAAGSGITPVISIAHSVLLKEPQSKVILFYGNKDANSIILKKKIDELAKAHNQSFECHYIYSREKTKDDLFHGRIDKSKTERLYAEFLENVKTPEFFICGPDEMIKNIEEVLKHHKIDHKNIHFEYFTTVETSAETLDLPNIDSTVTVILDDEEYSFELNSCGKPLLDAAEEEGLDVPFSCKGGVCCTCKAQVLEGEVVMQKNYSLNEEDVKNNYILSCQAHPVSKKVVITFDV